MTADRFCAWCMQLLPTGKRRDARTCSQPCRQARSRFRVVSPRRATEASLVASMRFAYADPPYPGLARRYYGCPEVDHAELVAHLESEFPDGWALSTSAKALRQVLALCPGDVRVCAWVKGPRRGRAWRPRSSWEPLIVARGRPRQIGVAEDLRDALVYGGRHRSHPGALIGMKPATFCEWMFQQLGAAPGDELADLFPGSGAVTRAWSLFAGSGDASLGAEATLERGATRVTEAFGDRRSAP